jgi:glycerol-3-phosphate dehydrogenase
MNSSCLSPDPRAALWQRLAQQPEVDLVVIGGGATGVAVALDAVTRGHRVALLEAVDFAKGTSSRATKLLHGGVRYLAQGQIALVREALHERTVLMAQAPHLAQPLAFVMPAAHVLQRALYATGLRLYDLLAGRRSLGRPRSQTASQLQHSLPALARAHGGGVRFWDGQFDDARLALAMARTAAAHGALVINHAPVTQLLSEDARVCGVQVQDAQTGQVYALRAACVVNAAGVWVEDVAALGADHAARAAAAVSPSQGVHLVVDRDFWPCEQALIVPASDGRVLFAVPWLGKVLLGTTDTPREDRPLEPRPLAQEVDWILAEIGRSLLRAPTRADIRSQWAGLRPLVRPTGSASGQTQRMSREHTVTVDPSGLVGVWGGKWTTCRAMAEDVLATCTQAGLLPDRGSSRTAQLTLLGAPDSAQRPLHLPPAAALYGTEQSLMLSLPGAQRWLWQDGDGGLTEAMVRFAALHEMARTVEDVLARRSRLLFLDAREALRVAPEVARILADALGQPIDAQALAGFEALAAQYAGLSQGDQSPREA